MVHVATRFEMHLFKAGQHYIYVIYNQLFYIDALWLEGT